jgi:hypothetical protein
VAQQIVITDHSKSGLLIFIDLSSIFKEQVVAITVLATKLMVVKLLGIENKELITKKFISSSSSYFHNAIRKL